MHQCGIELEGLLIRDYPRRRSLHVVGLLTNGAFSSISRPANIGHLCCQRCPRILRFFCATQRPETQGAIHSTIQCKAKAGGLSVSLFQQRVGDPCKHLVRLELLLPLLVVVLLL